MLTSFSRSLPFLFIRIVLVLGEGATLLYGSIYIHGWFEVFMSGHVEGLFLKVVSLMGWIIGLAVSAFIVKYVFGIAQYYFKLAHIIYLTMVILEYRPTRNSPLIHSFAQATTHFGWLVLHDFTTRGVVKALEALKNAILNIDLLSRFKETQSLMVRFVKMLCTTALGNVINMTDEIIVSYTWFTNDLYLANRERQGKGAPKLKDKVKNQALFMLEGMAFTVRVLPQLLINSVIFEVAFLLLAFLSSIGIVVLVGSYLGFSFFYIVASLILFRTLIHIFYYVIVQSLRLNVYLYSFYSELGDLEPFNITEMIGNLLGKVPLIGPLVKKSGQRIEPTGTEGSSILEGDLNSLMRENVAQVAAAFNLNTEELVEEPSTEEEPGEQLEEEEEFVEEQEEVVEETTGNSQEVEAEPIPEGDIELDIEESPQLFNESNRVTNQRR